MPNINFVWGVITVENLKGGLPCSSYLHDLVFFWLFQLIFRDSSVIPPCSILLPTVNNPNDLFLVFLCHYSLQLHNNIYATTLSSFTIVLINFRLQSCSLSSKLFLPFIHLLIQDIFLVSTMCSGHGTKRWLKLSASIHIVHRLPTHGHIEKSQQMS